VRGIALCWINSRNLALDQRSETHSREHPATFAPSPLTPLPRWGEGDRTPSGYPATKTVVTIFCNHQIDDARPSPHGCGYSLTALPALESRGRRDAQTRRCARLVQDSNLQGFPSPPYLRSYIALTRGATKCGISSGRPLHRSINPKGDST
jgi:hypothetical protein